jgi:adenine phosphoribosyltransferase
MDLKKYIRDIPDFPKKGILFHDVTTLFKNSEAFNYVVNALADRFKNRAIGYVAAIKLNCGMIPIRKPGKLPFHTISETYELEYGSDKLEIHQDAVKKGDKVLVIDDLVATGGTLLAGVKLIEKLGAEVIGVGSIIDMPDLGGRSMLKNYDYQYLVVYEGH